MSISDLKSAVRNSMNKRIESEGRAMRGTIQNGRLIVGAKQYEPVRAVDVNTANGARVYALPSADGKAVIVGA